jgi:hypothetical protein
VSTNLVRVDSPDVVVTIAQANRARYSRSPWAASVTLDEVTYFWSAA